MGIHVSLEAFYANACITSQIKVLMGKLDNVGTKLMCQSMPYTKLNVCSKYYWHSGHNAIAVDTEPETWWFEVLFRSSRFIKLLPLYCNKNIYQEERGKPVPLFVQEQQF